MLANGNLGARWKMRLLKMFGGTLDLDKPVATHLSV